MPGKAGRRDGLVKLAEQERRPAPADNDGRQEIRPNRRHRCSRNDSLFYKSPCGRIVADLEKKSWVSNVPTVCRPISV
jgi:hypothetical protein